MLTSLLISPLYLAVMLCVPRVNADVLIVAVVPDRDTVPRFVEPSKNVTLPVGDVKAETVAVRVIFCPTVEGLTEDMTCTLEDPLVTSCGNMGDVLVAKLASPLYTAVMLCIPGVNVDMLKLAVPFTNGDVPRVVVPSKNVTVPVGAPDAEPTLDRKVTLCPKEEGIAEDVTPIVVGALFTTCVNADEVLAV